MKSSLKAKLTAPILRNILAATLLLTAILVGVGFYLAQSTLNDFAKSVSNQIADSNASDSKIQTLQRLKQELAKREDVAQRTASIVADSKSYEYQDQIISDLSAYARDAQLSIAEFNFTGTTPPKAGVGATATPAAPAPAGLKSTSVSVILRTPVSYVSLLRFINSIEQNLTKMQLERISLVRSDDSPDAVSSEAFVIEVYIR